VPRTACYFIQSAMTGSIVSVFPFRNRVSLKEAFEGLELGGHSGSLSTVHATSAKQGLARFTSCVLQSGVDLPYRAIKMNVSDSVNVVVHLERRPGRRFVSEVVEIHGYDPDRDEFNYGRIFDSHKEVL
jgi:Flp pilus assembly CpaF family ATPase